MLQRTGEVMIRMLADVQRATIEPLIRGAIAVGSVVHTDEYAIYSMLVMMMAMASARSTSTRWRVSGRCCGVGCVPIGGFAGEAAALPGVLRVHPQRPGPGQERSGGPDGPLARTTPQPVMSLRELAENFDKAVRTLSDEPGREQVRSIAWGSPGEDLLSLAFWVISARQFKGWNSFAGIAARRPNRGRARG